MNSDILADTPEDYAGAVQMIEALRDKLKNSWQVLLVSNDNQIPPLEISPRTQILSCSTNYSIHIDDGQGNSLEFKTVACVESEACRAWYKSANYHSGKRIIEVYQIEPKAELIAKGLQLENDCV